MTKTPTVKALLLEVLQEIEDLRTDQAVLGATKEPPTRLGDAYALKSAAYPKVAKRYAKLRAKIEKLP